MTPAERLHFDVNGYVLLKGVVSREERRWLLGLAQRMKVHSPYRRQDLEHQTVLFGPAWYEPACLDLAMDPRLRAPAEAIVGSEARLEENEFIVFHPPVGRRAAAAPPDAEAWHRGMRPAPASFEAEGHYHCLFVKTLVYLSDNCETSGTWVIPGSHRMPHEVGEVIRVADASLMRQVSPQPGDVLLFGTEPTGLPAAVLADPRITAAARIPMLPARRSLNLSNAAAIVVYEAWRQHGYPGAAASGPPVVEG